MTRNVWRMVGIGAQALLLSTAADHTASAATLALLQDGRTIVWVDSEQRAVTGSVALAKGSRSDPGPERPDH